MRAVISLLAAVAIAFAMIGCISTDIDTARSVANVVAKFTPNKVEMRKRSANPLAGTLNLLQWSGPEPTEEVKLFLRRFDLVDLYNESPDQALAKLHHLNSQQPGLDITYAVAELAYIQGQHQFDRGKKDKAYHWYMGAIGHAHQYLFDPQLANRRNQYSPEFRRVCEIYNQSLEGMLRIARDNEQLHDGSELSVSTCGTQVDFKISIKGRWKGEQFDRFEFVSDYKTPAIKNNYHNYGLGVPLIAVRKYQITGENRGTKNTERVSPADEEKFYPPGLSLPLTAFFRWEAVHDIPAHYGVRYKATIELLDPLEVSTVKVHGQEVPIESNITTPLVYFLDDPLLRTDVFALFAMLDANFAEQFEGLYMLEPYNPNKIPVVMVHGLASSPMTWLDMFNDLRADPALRDRYQFWFYLYPSGQPFWASAKQMRDELDQLHRLFDPGQENWSLNQMVLVGHSMGGLVSRMQTLDSGNEFWNVISDKPFEMLEAPEEEKRELAKLVFFHPNPSVKRVVTIATPHHGSNFANGATQWLSHRFFKLPNQIFSGQPDLLKDNKDVIRDPNLVAIKTSVDSLSPESPVFPAMLKARTAPWVKYHNIIGRVKDESTFSIFKASEVIEGEGDGVVSVKSAEMNDVVSQVEVPASHTTIHSHPRTIQEVRRILLIHLAESDARWHLGQQNQQQNTSPNLFVEPREIKAQDLPPVTNATISDQ